MLYTLQTVHCSTVATFYKRYKYSKTSIFLNYSPKVSAYQTLNINKLFTRFSSDLKTLNKIMNDYTDVTIFVKTDEFMA